jgi:putative flippase GtrA
LASHYFAFLKPLMTVKTLPPVLTRQALRFALSGLLVTGLHVLIATAFIHIVLPAPPLANGVAFVVATIFSYLINTTWSFSNPFHGRNLFRFCIVSCIGLFLAVTISGTAQYYGLHYLYGIGLVVCIVPPLTFLLHNYWTYR